MRKCFVVSWEISSETVRQAVIAQLKAYGGFCPIHQNSWAVLTEQTAAQIRDALLKLVGATDRLFVVRSGGEGAWSNSYGDKHNDWLKTHL